MLNMLMLDDLHVKIEYFEEARSLQKNNVCMKYLNTCVYCSVSCQRRDNFLISHNFNASKILDPQTDHQLHN